METLPLKDSSTFAARAGKYVEHVLSVMGDLSLPSSRHCGNAAQPKETSFLCSKPSDRTLVIIPTYNERDNLPLITQLAEQRPTWTFLLLTTTAPTAQAISLTTSPATTSKFLCCIAKAKAVCAVPTLRASKWGLERDYQVLCEMDADGSHAPEQLHLLLAGGGSRR